jgi:hypothetical protein
VEQSIRLKKYSGPLKKEKEKNNNNKKKKTVEPFCETTLWVVGHL